ncbi:Hsp70 family protein [Microbacterium testaceum]|uniref:Hsp70 family protein n=1 Tax=Microbacterium testaceum TaxID=2033 RepID=UPI0012445320|nr:Hsp70 family protein [Microbacterium testaceum]
MATPYYLAIDVGTSRTAAAVARFTAEGELAATPLSLGRNADNTPTTVFVADSGLLFGDAAERRGTAQPERLIREFKRRIGDDVPIVTADRRFSPQDLYALMVGWVIGTAVEREGEHPAGIAVSVPVTWGEYRTRLVQDAIGRLGWADVQVITEPEAAARHYESTHPLDIGRALAVYDFGGGTFDTVILQKTIDGRVDFIGAPVGIPDLGGADFDDIVLRHTVRAAGIPASDMAGVATDPGLRMALASLRRECVEAKESLSFDGEAVVPVLVGGGHGAVRLTRAEFEDMIEPEIERTIEVLEIALEQSGLTPDDLDAILLTGGTSRIPRVAQLLSERFDRPIAVDADPKAIIALGAARVAAGVAVGELTPVLLSEPAAAVEDDDHENDDDDDSTDELGFRPTRAEKRAPWFHRVPATAYVAAGVTALAVGVGVVSIPAMGVGIFARSAVTSQPLAAEEAVVLFEPLNMPSSPPASIAAPDIVPVSEQVAAPEAAAPEQPGASKSSEPRQRTPQRLTPRTAEERSPSTAPQQQSNGGGNGGGGGSAPTNNQSPAQQQQQPTTNPPSESSSPSASTSPPSTEPVVEPSPSDTGSTAPSTEPTTTQEPTTPPAETSPPATDPPAETTAPSEQPQETTSPDPTASASDVPA